MKGRWGVAGVLLVTMADRNGDTRTVVTRFEEGCRAGPGRAGG